jgi:hypothetical protein
MGVPTVPVITQRFTKLVETIAYKKGIPNMRFAFVPHPISGRSAAISNKYIRGNDPITGRPLMAELIEGLTKPLSDEDKKAGFLMRDPRPRLLEPDTETNLGQMFIDNNWTDGLPIILPTEERVAEMLKGTSRRPDETVGSMRPSPPPEAWEYTVEMVAANSVMAGAKPEYFPVILALASTGVTSLFSSTTSFARMMVVNGPIAGEINMNPGIGAMGPFNHANATIGRAWTLISKNLGASGTPGETYLGSQGNTLNYNNVCFPENEAELPSGWKPFHVQKGFKQSESVVSTLNGWSLSNVCYYLPYPHQEIMKQWLSHFFSTGTRLALGNATMLIDPVVASDLAESGGFGSKEQLSNWLAQSATTPAFFYWARNRQNYIKAQEGEEPYASWLRLETGDIPASNYLRGATPGTPGMPGAKLPPGSKSQIEIIVVGGGTNPYWSGGDFQYISSASIDSYR